MTELSPADTRFEELVEALSDSAGVTVGAARGGFGSGALKVDGRIFAMVTRQRLVFKVPRTRVVELIESGEGVPFDAGKGRPMKEWVAFETMPSRARSGALGREALAFVAGRPRSAGAGQGDGVVMSAARKLFDSLAEPYLAQPGAERRRMFGSDGLRANGKFFAFLSKDRLVVKVPPDAARALIAKGHASTAESVSPTMRNWTLVPYVPTAAGRTRWRRLVADAHTHVAAAG